MAAKAEHGDSILPSFNEAAHWVLKAATIGLVAGFVGGVFWQMIIDPIFFPILHDTSNIIAQAWVDFVHEGLSIVPETLGLTGDWGFLQTDFMQGVLADEIALNTPPAPTEIPTGIQQDGLDFFMNM